MKIAIMVNNDYYTCIFIAFLLILLNKMYTTDLLINFMAGSSFLWWQSFHCFVIFIFKFFIFIKHSHVLKTCRASGEAELSLIHFSWSHFMLPPRSQERNRSGHLIQSDLRPMKCKQYRMFSLGKYSVSANDSLIFTFIIDVFIQYMETVC